MRSNLLAGGLIACSAGCLALTAIPGLGFPAEAACTLGAGAVIGGIFLWKPKVKAVGPETTEASLRGAAE